MKIYFSFFLPTSRFIWQVNIYVPAKARKKAA